MTDLLEPSADVEQVVLLDDAGAPIGVADKATVHSEDTPLHLAFSCHVVGPDGQVLVTRRALGKRAFAGIWTNAFCGHPSPGERIEDAVARRAERELGLVLDELELVLPDFRYRAVDAGGIVEHEICPVFRARVSADPRPAADEVADWAWVQPAQLSAAVALTPFAFSPWLALQLREWELYPG
ncbi:isopentenyl-diphosphate Delta-isomerase [Homoserinibacter sp. YIM 151385]|uniref:isopentenyl-diphosphate Delta-isomerase n=1 Tax=Homoserinibacter sp. YIM 151385 TaxID=2985506 RepID=UPI0022F0E634|nr:isopentenyl-diphosphate Delta-isomerase [Homoserinibacter sp. YIM 151385]WBU37297.1 isopentenyl-diphosphate Delta-isomerase [Homoserinibacter sp. YIM 151385]